MEIFPGNCLFVFHKHLMISLICEIRERESTDRYGVQIMVTRGWGWGVAEVKRYEHTNFQL